MDFYPRPPRGGRPTTFRQIVTPCKISIHALREEGDKYSSGFIILPLNFYPRPPRGGRQLIYCSKCETIIISIHALREEGDAKRGNVQSTGSDFYPRPPRGGRHPAGVNQTRKEVFLSTPSARRATSYQAYLPAHPGISIHALREEGDLMRMPERSSPFYFYPRPPRGGRQQKQRQNLYFQTNYTTFCTNLEEP